MRNEYYEAILQLRPYKKEVYDFILTELKEYGIKFNEKKVDYLGYNPLSLGA